jgi:hypothetical protein
MDIANKMTATDTANDDDDDDDDDNDDDPTMTTTVIQMTASIERTPPGEVQVGGVNLKALRGLRPFFSGR